MKSKKSWVISQMSKTEANEYRFRKAENLINKLNQMSWYNKLFCGNLIRKHVKWVEDNF